MPFAFESKYWLVSCCLFVICLVLLCFVLCGLVFTFFSIIFEKMWLFVWLEKKNKKSETSYFENISYLEIPRAGPKIIYDVKKIKSFFFKPRWVSFISFLSSFLRTRTYACVYSNNCLRDFKTLRWGISMWRLHIQRQSFVEVSYL